MQRSIAAAAAVLAAAFATGLEAQSGAEKAQMELDAAAAKGDKAAHERLLTDDFTWVDQAGRLRDKKTVLNDVRPATGKSYTESVDVRPYPGGAVLIGTRKNPGGIDVRFLRLWVQQGNQWRLAAHQGTPITEKPVSAATNPSASMSPNSGPASEIKAIEQAIAALTAGNAKGDAKNFAASVTDDFVAINATGNVASKQQRIAEITKGPNPTGPAATVEETSTRIYGDLAVTNRVTKGASGRNRVTIIHAKQGGKWLRAGIVATPIATGKAVTQ
jgi:ketosteroid isomerase-like protein